MNNTAQKSKEADVLDPSKKFEDDEEINVDYEGNKEYLHTDSDSDTSSCEGDELPTAISNTNTSPSSNRDDDNLPTPAKESTQTTSRKELEKFTTRVIESVPDCDYECVRNYDGSSGAMESDGLLLLLYDLYKKFKNKVYHECVVTDDATKLKKLNLTIIRS